MLSDPDMDLPNSTKLLFGLGTRISPMNLELRYSYAEEH